MSEAAAPTEDEIAAQRKKERTAVRAREAKMLLEHPLLVESFDLMENTFTNAWRNAAVEDAAGQQKCHLMLKAIDMFRAQLTSVMTSGTIASAEEQERLERERAEKREREWTPE